MPGQAHADMMRVMSEGNFVDSAVRDCQPDLFDDPGGIGGEVVRTPSVTAPRPLAAALSDGELIAMLPQAGRSNVEPLSAEVVSRSLIEAVPAVEALWRRLSGFGIRVTGASVTISTSSIESLAKARQAATSASNSKVPWSNPFAISITVK